MKIKKYIELFKELEINRNTKDVDNVYKHLNFELYVKQYLFVFGIGFLSFWIYLQVLNSIKENEFRAKLIEKAHVSPIASIFYDDYSEEREKAIQEAQKLRDQLVDLRSATSRRGGSSFYYSYSDFVSDVKSGKVKVNFAKEYKEQIDEYLKSYFLSYLTQNENKKIQLGSKQYTFIAISKKVSGLPKKEALEKLRVPADSILGDIDMPKTEENIKALTNAIYILANLDGRSTKFHKNLKIDNNALAKVKEAFYNQKSNIELHSDGYIRRIAIPELYDLYKAQKVLAKKHHAQTLAERKRKYSEAALKEKAIRKQLAQIETLLQDINRLQEDVSKYDELEEKIEKDLEALKWD